MGVKKKVRLEFFEEKYKEYGPHLDPHNSSWRI